MVRQIENYISLPFSSKPLTLKINMTLLCIFFVLFEITALCMAQVRENGKEGERGWGTKFPQLKVRQCYSLEFLEIKQNFKNVFETILADEKILHEISKQTLICTIIHKLRISNHFECYCVHKNLSLRCLNSKLISYLWRIERKKLKI